MNKPDQFELPGAEAAFNLAGEETIDGARVQAEAEAQAQAAAEAKAKQEREQLPLSEDWRVKTWPDGHRAECLYIGGQYVGESREPGKHEAQTDTGEPGHSSGPQDREELAKLLGVELCQTTGGISVPASSDYYQEYIDRAEGKAPSVIGQPYWD